MNKSELYLFLFVTIILTCGVNSQKSIESQTKFVFYGEQNQEVFTSTSKNDSLTFQNTGCKSSEPYALIVPGWRESCNTTWVEKLRSNLIVNRKGCIICMDLRSYNEDYGYLLANFKIISQVLTDKLNALRSDGFRPETAYLFGFSFGARVIAKAGIDFGKKLLGRIDLCEPAGPGFENTQTNADPKMAAQNCQCIHTARGGYGTREEICDQNWFMGNCGEWQVGARPFPNGNHGLCPQFYNFAFTNVFLAVPKSMTCNQGLTPRDAKVSPQQEMRMGYWQTINPAYNLTEKTFYAITTRDPPFNSDKLFDGSNKV